MHVPHRWASRWPRGHPRVRRARSPGAPRSRGSAPCRGEPEVRRWPRLAPYEPPRTAGREWTCQEWPPNILLKCSVYKPNVPLGYGGNTGYAPPCYCPLTLRCPRGGGKSAFEILIHRPRLASTPCDDASPPRSAPD